SCGRVTRSGITIHVRPANRDGLIASVPRRRDRLSRSSVRSLWRYGVRSGGGVPAGRAGRASSRAPRADATHRSRMGRHEPSSGPSKIMRPSPMFRPAMGRGPLWGGLRGLCTDLFDKRVNVAQDGADDFGVILGAHPIEDAIDHRADLGRLAAPLAAAAFVD